MLMIHIWRHKIVIVIYKFDQIQDSICNLERLKKPYIDEEGPPPAVLPFLLPPAVTKSAGFSIGFRSSSHSIGIFTSSPKKYCRSSVRT